MTPSSLMQDAKLVCDLVSRKMREGTRTIVGIAGPPGSGKSTLAKAVVRKLREEPNSVASRAALLPMDGYHLDNRLLEARGLLARKGAPETFDAHGFCEAVRLLSLGGRESFHPDFDRQADLAIAGAIAIDPDTPVIVVEGNFLLLRSAPWSSLRELFAATVFVCPSMDVLRERLQRRWIRHGLDPEAALRRAVDNDLPNAELVMRESRKADLRLTQQLGKGPAGS